MKSERIQDNRIKKLPVWAQDIIKDLDRERKVAIQALNEYCDSQTPAPFYIDEWESTGETKGPTTKTRYIQTRKIEVDHEGVHLSVGISNDNDLVLQWSDQNRGMGEVAFIPESYQRARIVSKENMRG